MLERLVTLSYISHTVLLSLSVTVLHCRHLSSLSVLTQIVKVTTHLMLIDGIFFHKGQSDVVIGHTGRCKKIPTEELMKVCGYIDNAIAF